MPTRPDDVAIDDVPADDEDLLSELGELTDPGLADLLDPDRWADDDPAEDVPLPREPTDAVSYDALAEAPDDDDGSFIQPAVTEEVPVPLLDQEAVVLPWCGEVLVDGEPTPMIADPTAATTTLSRPTTTGRQRVRIRALGCVAHCTIEVVEGPPSVRLGRDVLAGRFVVSATED